MTTVLFPILAAEESSNQVQQVLETFGFQWQLFISQCVSFIVVALILRVFAYKPVLTILEQRRKRIAEGEENARKIQQQLAEAEMRFSARLTEANNEAQRLIEEARSASSSLRDKKTQEAIAEAEQIIAKAREATTIERDKMMVELKREVGRLVIETTGRVAGRVLTPEDHRRLADETAHQVA